MVRNELRWSPGLQKVYQQFCLLESLPPFLSRTLEDPARSCQLFTYADTFTPQNCRLEIYSAWVSQNADCARLHPYLSVPNILYCGEGEDQGGRDQIVTQALAFQGFISGSNSLHCAGLVRDSLRWQLNASSLLRQWPAVSSTPSSLPQGRTERSKKKIAGLVGLFY